MADWSLSEAVCVLLCVTLVACNILELSSNEQVEALFAGTCLNHTLYSKRKVLTGNESLSTCLTCSVTR